LPGIVVAPVDTSLFTAPATTALLAGEAMGARLLEHASQLANPGGVALPSTSANGAIWIASSTDRLSLDGGSLGAPGFGVTQYRFTAGADWRVGRYVAGGALSYGHSDLAEQTTGDHGRDDTLRLSLYGARDVGPVTLAAAASYAYHDVHLYRPLGSPGTAEGGTAGNEVVLGTQAGLPLTAGVVNFTPHLGWLVAYYRGNGFAESGAGGQNLGVGADNARSVQPYAGVSVDTSFGNGAHPMTLRLNVDYGLELARNSRAVTVFSADGTAFDAPGVSLPRGRLVASVRAAGALTKHVELGVGFSSWLNTGRGSQLGGDVAIRYRF
jgi:uncharacterized protein with beta-barrel porin domain